MIEPRIKTRVMPLLVIALVLLGLWQCGSGAWIYLKAELAQVLLQRAWADTVAGQEHVTPWPWADTWPVARLIVPDQNIDQIVLEGAYGRTLAFGPAHVESSGGMGNPGTAILTGHRDTHFRFLDKLQPNEAILIQTRTGAWLRFAVQDRQVVNSRTASISAQEDAATLVLVTCYPFDAIAPGGPLRYVVVAVEDKGNTGGAYPLASIAISRKISSRSGQAGYGADDPD